MTDRLPFTEYLLFQSASLVIRLCRRKPNSSQIPFNGDETIQNITIYMAFNNGGTAKGPNHASLRTGGSAHVHLLGKLPRDLARARRALEAGPDAANQL